MIGNLGIRLEMEVGELLDSVHNYLKIASTLNKYISYMLIGISTTAEPKFSIKGGINLEEAGNLLEKFVSQSREKISSRSRYWEFLGLQGTVLLLNPINGSKLPVLFEVMIFPSKVIFSTIDSATTCNFLTDPDDPNEFVLKNLEKLEEIAQHLLNELKPNSLVIGENVLGGPSLTYWIEYHKDYNDFTQNIYLLFESSGKSANDIIEEYLKEHNKLSKEAKAVLGKRSREAIFESLKENVPSAEIDALLEDVIKRHPTSKFRKEGEYVYFKTSQILPFTTSDKPPNYSENASIDLYCNLFLKMIEEEVTTGAGETIPHIKITGAEKVTDPKLIMEIIKAWEGAASIFDPIAEKWRVKIAEGVNPQEGVVKFIKDVESYVNQEIDEQMKEDAETYVKELREYVEMTNKQFNVKLEVKNA